MINGMPHRNNSRRLMCSEQTSLLPPESKEKRFTTGEHTSALVLCIRKPIRLLADVLEALIGHVISPITPGCNGAIVDHLIRRSSPYNLKEGRWKLSPSET